MECLSHETRPDFEVAKACQISMSLPLLFTPSKIGPDTYVDGGILMNIPVKHITSEEMKKTIVFRVYWGYEKSLTRMDSYISRVVYVGLNAAEGKQWAGVKKEVMDRTVSINVEISTTNFQLTSDLFTYHHHCHGQPQL